MSPEEVERKAAWLMDRVLGKKNSDQVIEAVQRIESVTNVRELTKLMTSI